MSAFIDEVVRLLGEPDYLGLNYYRHGEETVVLWSPYPTKSVHPKGQRFLMESHTITVMDDDEPCSFSIAGLEPRAALDRAYSIVFNGAPESRHVECCLIDQLTEHVHPSHAEAFKAQVTELLERCRHEVQPLIDGAQPHIYTEEMQARSEARRAKKGQS